MISVKRYRFSDGAFRGVPYEGTFEGIKTDFTSAESMQSLKDFIGGSLTVEFNSRESFTFFLHQPNGFIFPLANGEWMTRLKNGNLCLMGSDYFDQFCEEVTGEMK